MTSSLSRCPIEDVLPWTTRTTTTTTTTTTNHHGQPSSSSSPLRGGDGGENNNDTTILVTDRVVTSGRFLLYVTAAHAYRRGDDHRNDNNNNNNNHHVLWLNFASDNSHHIRQGMKRMGCSVTAATKTTTTTNDGSNGTGTSSAPTTTTTFTDTAGRMTIRSVAAELAQHILRDPDRSGMVDDTKNDGGDNNKNNNTMEQFIRDLYHDVRVWYRNNRRSTVRGTATTGGDDDDDENSTMVILLDDVSALADMIGPKLAYAFVYQITCWVKNKLDTTNTTRLVIRCAGDGSDDVPSSTSSSSMSQTTENNTRTSWVGHGGGGSGTASPSTSVGPTRWESSLVELCDWIADVLPLQSGYSREAHGRLSLTPRSTSASSSSSSSSPSAVRYNYCVTDQAVYAIRLANQQKRQ